MKSLRILFAVLLMVHATSGSAQQDISGTWAGDLAVGSDTTLEILFVLTLQPDGSYSGVVTSTDPEGIQDMPATSVSFEANQLVLAVEALRGRYEGTFADGGFSGTWIQPDGSIPLELAPYVAPVLTDADKDLLRGSWVGALELPIGKLAIVFRFESDADGEFVAFLDSPDQGANGIPISNIELDDGHFEFRVTAVGGSYTATLADGRMDGTWSQGQDMPLVMERGEYTPEGLELSDEAFSRLEGSWVGQVSNPAGGVLNVVFRFERDQDGNVAAFLDSPDQGASGIPINEVTLDGDQLSLTITAAQASYAATFTDDRIEGTWSQGPGQQPLVLARGEYTPTAVTLDLSDEAMAELEGAWRGQIERGQLPAIEIVMRFERTPEGQPVAFLDVQGANGVSINEASLVDGQLSLSISAAAVNYTGSLAGGQIDGVWAQGGQTLPLVLTKD